MPRNRRALAPGFRQCRARIIWIALSSLRDIGDSKPATGNQIIWQVRLAVPLA